MLICIDRSIMVFSILHNDMAMIISCDHVNIESMKQCVDKVRFKCMRGSGVCKSPLLLIGFRCSGEFPHQLTALKLEYHLLIPLK